MKIKNNNYKMPASGLNHVMVHGDNYKNWLSSVIALPEGFVLVAGWGGTGYKHKVTSLSFIYKGRRYSRHFSGKCYSKRGCMKKAKEFVADVVAGRV